MKDQENLSTANHDADAVNDDRRKFLASCGRFAAVTPPAITMLLSTSLNSDAVAQSAGGGGNGRRGNGGNGQQGNNGFGNGGGDGGNKEDINR